MRAHLGLLPLLAIVWAGCPGDEGDDKGQEPCAGEGLPDACDGEDNDCDGEVDEDAPTQMWYADGDGDGYGGDQDGVIACAPPEGYYEEALDCDDDDEAISPDAQEVCGGEDEDCDGLTDDDDPSVSGLTSWFLDEDGDGLGAGPSYRFCEQPDGYVDDGSDCDDGDDTVLSSLTWYADGDGDGFGDASASTESCEAPEGYVAGSDDCDDGANDIYPGAEEVCLDERDNDCDGTANGCVPLEGAYAYTDADVLITGSSSYFGANVRHADTDGDGVEEVVTSAPYASSYAGVVYLFEGLAPGDSGSESLATMQLFGSTTYGYLGYGVGDGADLDGDGYDDLFSYSLGSSMVVVVDGPISAGDSVDRATAAYSGLSSSPPLQRSWIVGADMDGDGAASLLVGDPYYTGSYSYEGLVYVLSDPPDESTTELKSAAVASISSDATYAYLGMQIANLGDVDGDGMEDVGFGSYYYSYGYSYNGLSGIFSGDLSGSYSLSSADLIIFGSANYQYSGAEMTGLGDVDGDGRDDVGIAAWYDSSLTGSSVGTGYVFLSPPGAGSVSTARADVFFYGTDTSERFAQQLAGADLDGDGSSDVASGDYMAESYGGAVHLFYGPFESGSYADTDADATIAGTATDSSRDYLAYDVGGVGDLNGDGYEELGVSIYGRTTLSLFFGGAL